MKKTIFLVLGVFIGISISFASMYFVNKLSTHSDEDTESEDEYYYEIVAMDSPRISRYLSKSSYIDMLDEIRNHKTCSDHHDAFDIVMKTDHLKNYARDEGEILVTYDEAEGMYIIFFPLKDSEYECRLLVDEYTGSILQVANLR